MPGFREASLARCCCLAAGLLLGWTAHAREAKPVDRASGSPASTRGSSLGTAARVDPSVALDAAGYAAELERWARAIARLDTSRAAIASLRDSLPAAWTV